MGRKALIKKYEKKIKKLKKASNLVMFGNTIIETKIECYKEFIAALSKK